MPAPLATARCACAFSDIVIQALYHTAALSIALYGRAIRLIGASAAGAFVALRPVIATLISIPVLGEKP